MLFIGKLRPQWLLGFKASRQACTYRKPEASFIDLPCFKPGRLPFFQPDMKKMAPLTI